MSDISQGPGWWMASDGRWYPPESHPAAAHRSGVLPPSRSSMPGWAIAVIVGGCVLFVLVVIAVAIPVFLGVQKNNEKSAAHSTVLTPTTSSAANQTFANRFARSNVLTAATSVAALLASGPLTGNLPAQLSAQEPELSFTQGPATSSNQISVEGNTNSAVVAARSANGSCWFALVVPGSAMRFGDSPSGTCSAGDHPVSGWHSHF